MKCCFIRHGATRGNREHRYVGRTDEPVLASELEALERLGAELPFLEHVYTSPYLRCRQSAEALLRVYNRGKEGIPVCRETDPTIPEQPMTPCKEGISVCRETDAPLPSIEVIPDFREMDFGDFEYKNYQELNGNPDYQAYIDSGGMLAFPGGETPEAFQIRCCQAFLECVRRTEQAGFAETGFVVHGGTIMAILEAYASPRKGYFAYQVKNGCGYEVQVVKKPELCLEIIREIRYKS